MNELSNEELDKQALESNRVIVRIWTSGVNKGIPGVEWGHVSIQTPISYVSLWPMRAFDEKLRQREGAGIVETVTPVLLHSYETDRKAEEREPERTYCFYTLDVNEIEREFATVKRTLGGWCLLGRCKDGESCVSLAYRLLQAGGLDKLSGGRVVQVIDESSIAGKGAKIGFFNKSAALSTASGYAISSQANEAIQKIAEAGDASVYSVEMGVGLVIKSPDFLVEVVSRAKQGELKQNPLTAKITYPEETVISTTNDQDNAEEASQCSMM